MKRAPIALFSFITILGITTSCGVSYTHKTSDKMDIYVADIEHNGKITPDEKGLTWKQSYDVLMSQSNTITSLNAIADKLMISPDEPERTTLARYEILHEAEEVLMHTGAILPLYNYRDPFLLKPNINGIYACDLGTKMFDKLYDTNGQLHEFDVCVGTKSDTLDPAINVDAATAMIISNTSVGIKRWSKVTNREDTDINTRFLAKPEDGCASYIKRIVVNSEEEEKVDPNKYIWIEKCPDLYNSVYKDHYIGTARYDVTIKDGFKWSNYNNTNGRELNSEDFIWTWSRAASKSTGVWSSMFDCIRGYSGWHICADKTFVGRKISDLTEKEKADYDALPDDEKESYTEGETCIKGLIKDEQNSRKFTIQLINDCPYFDELLTFPVFLPLRKDIVQGNDQWWTKPETYFSTGPYCFSQIDNRDAGKLVLNKNENFPGKADVNANKLTFALLDDDTSMLTQFKSGQLQMIDAIPSGSIDDVKAMQPNVWYDVNQIALYYMIFNVNDNTFDYKADMSEEQREALRKATILLINRTDICNSIVKNGADPADGWVSTGVVEKCIPVYDETAKNPKGTKGAFVAKRVEIAGEKVLVELDWHYRNKDLYDELLRGECYDPRTGSYNLEKRNPEFDESGLPIKHAGGFYPTTTSDPSYDPKNPGSDASRNSEAQNLKKCIELAKTYAKKAGVEYVGDDETGKFVNFPEIKVTINTGTGHSDIAERMQAYYKLFGINLSIEQQEWNAFNHNKNAGNFALARNGWVADFSDARTYLDILTSTSANNDSQLGKNTWHRSR